VHAVHSSWGLIEQLTRSEPVAGAAQPLAALLEIASICLRVCTFMRGKSSEHLARSDLDRREPMCAIVWVPFFAGCAAQRVRDADPDAGPATPGARQCSVLIVVTVCCIGLASHFVLFVVCDMYHAHRHHIRLWQFVYGRQMMAGRLC
jgi:hypothetical protein